MEAKKLAKKTKRTQLLENINVRGWHSQAQLDRGSEISSLDRFWKNKPNSKIANLLHRKD